jgi:hypothetical protein
VVFGSDIVVVDFTISRSAAQDVLVPSKGAQSSCVSPETSKLSTFATIPDLDITT